MSKTIGIVGCGAIGSALSGFAQKELGKDISKIILFDLQKEQAEKLKSKLKNAEISQSLEEVIDNSDLVVESAIGKIVPEVLSLVIEKKKDLIIMSIGGLLGSEDILEKAREKKIKVIMPSGAISGIDALKAAGIAGLEEVKITTRKSPKSLKGAPYLEENKLDLEKIEGETVIFEGTALEAIKGFPKNVNVAVLLSLVGMGADKTKVKIVVSPEYTKNIHEIEIISKAGRITTRTENVPFPENPKTSFLAALSAMAALEGYFDSVKMGG